MDKKRREFIHKDYKKHEDLNLPFDIRKPKKYYASDIYHECSNCGEGTFINKYTLMYVCKHCNKLETVNGESR